MDSAIQDVTDFNPGCRNNNVAVGKSPCPRHLFLRIGHEAIGSRFESLSENALYPHTLVIPRGLQFIHSHGQLGALNSRDTCSFQALFQGIKVNKIQIRIQFQILL